MECSEGCAVSIAAPSLTTDFGGHSGGVTPVPIPNTEVKPASADGTWGETPWESRTPPDFSARTPLRGRSWRFGLGRCRRRAVSPGSVVGSPSCPPTAAPVRPRRPGRSRSGGNRPRPTGRPRRHAPRAEVTTGWPASCATPASRGRSGSRPRSRPERAATQHSGGAPAASFVGRRRIGRRDDRGRPRTASDADAGHDGGRPQGRSGPRHDPRATPSHRAGRWTATS